jgi:hypothetical protein
MGRKRSARMRTLRLRPDESALVVNDDGFVEMLWADHEGLDTDMHKDLGIVALMIKHNDRDFQAYMKQKDMELAAMERLSRDETQT